MHPSLLGSVKAFSCEEYVCGRGEGRRSHLDTYLPGVSQSDAKLLAPQALPAGAVLGRTQGLRAGSAVIWSQDTITLFSETRVFSPCVYLLGLEGVFPELLLWNLLSVMRK